MPSSEASADTSTFDGAACVHAFPVNRTIEQCLIATDLLRYLPRAIREMA